LWACSTKWTLRRRKGQGGEFSLRRIPTFGEDTRVNITQSWLRRQKPRLQKQEEEGVHRSVKQESMMIDAKASSSRPYGGAAGSGSAVSSAHEDGGV